MFCILLGLALPGRISGQNNSGQGLVPAAAADSSPDLQIQSSTLRIEFDRKLRSRIVALFGTTSSRLTQFSATETVSGIGRAWSDFALTSSRREHVSDVFGAGEKGRTAARCS